MDPSIPLMFLHMDPSIPLIFLHMDPSIPLMFLHMDPSIPLMFLHMDPSIPLMFLHMDPSIPLMFLHMDPSIPLFLHMDPSIPLIFLHMDPSIPHEIRTQLYRVGFGVAIFSVCSWFMWSIYPCTAGPWFNIKLSSYKYRKSHCGDKMVVRSSYLHNGISYNGKSASLYWTNTQVCSTGTWASVYNYIVSLMHLWYIWRKSISN